MKKKQPISTGTSALASEAFTDSGSTLLTREQVAAQLGLGTISVARRTWSGELRCVSFHRHVFAIGKATLTNISPASAVNWA